MSESFSALLDESLETLDNAEKSDQSAKDVMIVLAKRCKNEA